MTSPPPPAPPSPTQSRLPAVHRSSRSGRATPTVFDRVRGLPFAVVGSILVLGGVVLQLIALVGATWWRAELGKREFAFGFTGLGDRTQRGLAFIYFSWGAWMLLALSLALGAAACIRWRGARPFRFIGAIFGVAAAFVTIAALLVFAFQSNDGDLFKTARNYSAGVYLAVLGLIATALGAAAGGAGR